MVCVIFSAIIVRNKYEKYEMSNDVTSIDDDVSSRYEGSVL